MNEDKWKVEADRIVDSIINSTSHWFSRCGSWPERRLRDSIATALATAERVGSEQQVEATKKDEDTKALAMARESGDRRALLRYLRMRRGE